MTAFLILLALVIIVALIDAVPEFDIWQSRIHIGRYRDSKTWKNKITAKSIQWLKRTPTVKLTDNNRLVIIDIIRGNYTRNSIQHWQQAALLLGLVEAYEHSKDEKIRVAVETFIGSKIDSSGNWIALPTEVDGAILAYAILKTPWIDHQKYKPAFDSIWKMLQQMTGDHGTVQYRKHRKDFRYVDTIGFICPFLMRYGIVFGEEKAVELSLKQILTYNENGMFPGTMIPCHAYNVNTKLPSGLFGWGRGLGWYAIGLIDTWNELPSSHPAKAKLTENVTAFAKTAMAFQSQNGGWNWLVTNPHAQTDSSATATLAWYLSQVSGISEIKNEASASVEKAMDYLKSVTKRDGAIDLAQGDTKDIGVYSQTFGILPFAEGFALRTASRSKHK